MWALIPILRSLDSRSLSAGGIFFCIVSCGIIYLPVSAEVSSCTAGAADCHRTYRGRATRGCRSTGRLADGTDRNVVNDRRSQHLNWREKAVRIVLDAFISVAARPSPFYRPRPCRLNFANSNQNFQVDLHKRRSFPIENPFTWHLGSDSQPLNQGYRRQRSSQWGIPWKVPRMCKML